MPYKDLKPYYRTWIKRDLIQRLERYCNKTKNKKIDIVSKAVDIFLKSQKQ